LAAGKVQYFVINVNVFYLNPEGKPAN